MDLLAPGLAQRQGKDLTQVVTRCRAVELTAVVDAQGGVLAFGGSQSSDDRFAKRFCGAPPVENVRPLVTS